MDIAKAEAGERELDKFINSQAKKRKGAEEANALEAMWAASEARALAKQREENRTAWVEHYRMVAAAHLKLARSFRQRARQVESIDLKESA